ncbi:MAG: hypothetical protein C9356_18635, partial [Oleiphilus sp.]
MAAKSIGFISKLVGNAEIRTEDGVIKVAHLGDIVKQGEVVLAGQNSIVVIDFNSGEKLTVGPQASVALDDSVSFDSGDFSMDLVDQQAALQQLILDGLDVSALEETAAGRESQDSDSNSLHQSSVYERDGLEGQVETRLTPIDDDGLIAPDDNLGSNIESGINNAAGSAGSTESLPPVNTENITIALDASISADDVITEAEAAGTVAVSGSVGSDVKVGDAVALVINGETYTGLVRTGNTFSIDVAASDLVADPDSTIDATVTTTDAFGRQLRASDSEGYSVDVTPPSVSLSVDGAITADGIINLSESTSTVPVNGTVSGEFQAGDIVTLTINGTSISGPVSEDGSFSFDVPGSELVADPGATIGVSFIASDAAGNVAEPVTASVSYSVDTSASASIVVNNITADDNLNNVESDQTIEVSGAVGGDAAEGDVVSFTVNGTDYSTTVQSDGSYRVEVAGADLAGQPSFDVTVAGQDDAGNTFTASATSTHTVSAPLVATISLDEAITADDIINASEASGIVAVTGRVSGDFQAGDIVTLTINGVESTGPVAADGSFSIEVQGSDLLADADSTIQASFVATDAAGNVSEPVSTSESYAISTIVSLSATSSISEAGGTITYTASVDIAPETDMTVNLDNGESITIVAGETSGSVDVNVVADDDVYVSAETISASITGTSGGGLESVSINTTPATTAVTDTIDATTVSLSATGSITEAGGTVTYTASVDNAPATDMTVNLDNGETITIVAGNTSGSVDVTVAADEDAILDA